MKTQYVQTLYLEDTDVIAKKAFRVMERLDVTVSKMIKIFKCEIIAIKS